MLVDGKHRQFVFLTGALLSVLGFVFMLYCFFNLTRDGLILCGVTFAVCLIFDFLLQLAAVCALILHKAFSKATLERVVNLKSLAPEKNNLMAQIFNEYEIPTLDQIASSLENA